MSVHENSRRQHLKALNNIREFANSSDTSWAAGAKDACASEIAQVRRYIAGGVECGPGKTDLLDFFVRVPWVGRADFGALWEEYVKAGLVDTSVTLDIQHKKKWVKALPLEAALLMGNPSFFAGLIEAGAKVMEVPSRPWRPSPKTGKCSIKDINGFIVFAVKDPAKRSEFQAAATAARMNESIARGIAGTSPSMLQSAHPAKAPTKRKTAAKKSAVDLFTPPAGLPNLIADPMANVRPTMTTPAPAATPLPEMPLTPPPDIRTRRMGI
ncbi:hypothetical protein ABIC83_002498 [Roseateles asaccharophilus]|uniref:hypothetical protein n=1 Tax=Roseateles asaccharophilus TaxID=582607 RepID=UPI0038397137